MPIKKSELYSSLWSSCDELRGGMDASQYKDYVLVLLFIKYVSDKYAGQPYAPITIPAGASFKDMVALKGKSDIGDQINKKIIAPLANANQQLSQSDFPDFNDPVKLGDGKEKVERLTNLIAIFENRALDFSKNRAEGDDILGDAYEYLMRHFATESGKSKGQFYTPAEVSRVIAQVIGIRGAKTSAATTVYDPTCGSGSLLLKVADEAGTAVTLNGQEKDATTAGLARMNMILHNNPTALVMQGNTLTDPKFKDGDKLKTFDYVVANPPFSDKRWSTGLDPLNDPYQRFQPFGTPPARQGDYAYLLHIVRSLKSTGKGACILPHGVLFRGNVEADIRDPIHNLIAFSTKIPDDEVLWELLQSAPVQRLRRIKQLGFSEFVYPGATHSRFSHVLGAMQMARRMLDVFERNNIFTNKKDHPLQRRATLAAALLHDVGHGPYSHVFEEVAAGLKQPQSHESYTQQIIEESNIKNILRKHGVFVETKKFFTTEAGYDPYTRIISSQMDCDRLDFLVRDRYYTGIRSAAIDLAWLFDSLRIEEVPIDPVRQLKAYSFVVLPKGISVIEEFVLSYMKMYQNVYFHKTTRAVQHMVADIIRIAVSNELSLNKRIKANPVVRYFKSKKYRTLDNYLCLDDSSIISLLRDLADQKLGSVSKLAQRYFQRDTYKCVELPTYGSGEIRKSAATKFIERLQNSSIEFFDDRVPAKDYKQYDVMDENYLKNILVKKDSEYEPLGWNSELVKTPPTKKIRLYFKTDKDRNRAIKLVPTALA